MKKYNIGHNVIQIHLQFPIEELQSYLDIVAHYKGHVTESGNGKLYANIPSEKIGSFERYLTEMGFKLDRNLRL